MSLDQDIALGASIKVVSDKLAVYLLVFDGSS